MSTYIKYPKIAIPNTNSVVYMIRSPFLFKSFQTSLRISRTARSKQRRSTGRKQMIVLFPCFYFFKLINDELYLP